MPAADCDRFLDANESQRSACGRTAGQVCRDSHRSQLRALWFKPSRGYGPHPAKPIGLFIARKLLLRGRAWRQERVAMWVYSSALASPGSIPMLCVGRHGAAGVSGWELKWQRNGCDGGNESRLLCPSSFGRKLPPVKSPSRRSSRSSRPSRRAVDEAERLKDFVLADQVYYIMYRSSRKVRLDGPSPWWCIQAPSLAADAQCACIGARAEHWPTAQCNPTPVSTTVPRYVYVRPSASVQLSPLDARRWDDRRGEDTSLVGTRPSTSSTDHLRGRRQH